MCAMTKACLTASSLFLIPFSACAQWQSLNGGVDSFVRTFEVSPDSSSLLIGGNFKYVRQGGDSLLAAGLARWDGTTWSVADLAPPHPDSVPSLPRYVLSILELTDTIITSHGATNWPNQPQLNVAVLLTNGSWQPFGQPDLMLDFRMINERIFVGGEASVAFGTYMPGVREWKNGTLTQLPGSPWQSNVDVFGFAYWNGQYYFGGADNGEIGSYNIHAYDGDSTWSAVGGGMSSGWLRAVAGFGDSLYVGGYFFPGGNNLSTHIQLFDGTQWQPFFPQVEYIGQVWDIQVYQGALYVSGIYHFVGESTWYGLLRYDGQDLCAIGGPMPSGDNGKMAFFQDNLYMALAGSFPSLDFQWIGHLPLAGLIPDTCITITQSGISELEVEQLGVYPNPAEDQCNVMLSPASALMDLRVYDQLGRRVQVDPRKTLNGFTFRTDGLATGLYTVIASTGEGNFSGRFIKR